MVGDKVSISLEIEAVLQLELGTGLLRMAPSTVGSSTGLLEDATAPTERRPGRSCPHVTDDRGVSSLQEHAIP